jgi:hypothetical protein
MSPYSSSYTEQRKSRDPPAAQRSSSLPDEEFRDLHRAQNRERLESHFEHRGGCSRSNEPLHSAYRDAGLSREERRGISEVRSATRAALGPSFDFDEDSYGCSRRHMDDSQRSRGWTEEAPSGGTIPKKYLDEYDQRWHEDDEDNDADQYIADCTLRASWRKHERMDRYPVYVEPSDTRRPTAVAPRSVDRGQDSSHGDFERPVSRPQLTSSFSFDNYEEPQRERRRLGRSSRR